MHRYWINLLHIYQPPWQEAGIVLEMYKNSYLYTLDALEQNPQLKITLNICGSLTEHLQRHLKHDFFDRVRKLVAKGQVELVGTAMYHPILPLIPEAEILRQIKLNEDINQHYFKDEWRAAEALYSARGFFLPELAYSAEAAKAVVKSGFQWLALDEVAFRGLGRVAHGQVNWGEKYIHKASGAQLLIRRNFPTEETLQVVSNLPENTLEGTEYLVSVSDGEIYRETFPSNAAGLQHWDKLLKVANSNQIKPITVGEYFKLLDNNQAESHLVEPKASSWRTTEEEESLGSSFHNWLTPGDQIHKELWSLTQDAGELLKKYAKDAHMDFIRQEYDRALSSCTWWWVDGRDLGYSPSEVIKGLNVIINVVRSFRKLPEKLRLSFEQRYANLVYLIWERHWQNYD